MRSLGAGQIGNQYGHEDDDPLAAEQHVVACFDKELKNSTVDKAPIWVVFVEDKHGRIADHLARLAVLDERATSADQESFRRFIHPAQSHSHAAAGLYRTPFHQLAPTSIPPLSE